MQPSSVYIDFTINLYAVRPWSVHGECAMKHNKRWIFNYLHIRNTHLYGILQKKTVFLSFFSDECWQQCFVMCTISVLLGFVERWNIDNGQGKQCWGKCMCLLNLRFIQKYRVKEMRNRNVIYGIHRHHDKRHPVFFAFNIGSISLQKSTYICNTVVFSQ